MSDAVRYFAVIDPGSPASRAWQEAVGADFLEVESPEAELAVAPEGFTRRFYRARVDSLTIDQRARVAEMVADRFAMAMDEVRAEIDINLVLPILASRVRICSDPADGRAWYAAKRNREAESG